MEALVPLGITKIREARKYPVESLPLVIDLPRGPRPAELIAAREERANSWGASYLFLERAYGLRIPVVPKNVNARLPLDRRVRGFEQRVDDRFQAVLLVLRSLGCENLYRLNR
jgi:hypothetical protein